MKKVSVICHISGRCFAWILQSDKCVVIVVTQEYIVLELEFCLVVGTLAFGAAEFEDFAFVVICAALRDDLL